MIKEQLVPLTPQQLKFIEEYLIDSSSARGAAIRAGYSINTATQQASRLLADRRVIKAIEEAQSKATKSLGITAERVLQELALIAFSKPGELIRINEEGEIEISAQDLKDDRSGAAEVSVTSGKSGKVLQVKTIKPADRLAALEKIAKHLNMFKDQVEITTTASLAELVEASFDKSVKVSEPPEDPVE